MRRRSFLAVAGWLATAALATLIGVAAIRWVGESIAGTPGGVLSQEEIERALASPGPTVPGAGGPSFPTAGGTGGPPSPGATGSTPAGARRAFATTGGSAVVECGPGGVRLVSWTPAPGYRVSDAEPGPDDDVEVAFAGPSGEFELKLRCVGLEPVSVEDDD
ncbi:septum formation initiator [Micromonospora sp. AMSO12t]|uniref:septum formation initiator n=1 Tax=Micromonospora sp. AMSO12t TaxID=2650410 RepID=UPI00124B9E7A|nr:septum formation initiator [Micromonospora sp. AMSO12t]KAB1160236.1 septum formation initiator [Micromonospora sp. AMSO12t]